MKNLNLLIIAAVTYLFTANCAGRSISKERSSKTVRTDTSIKPTNQDSLPDAELVETYWKLTELTGKPVAKTPPDQKEPHIILKKQDNRVQGFAGCNSLGGFYELKGSSLKFREITTTLMACADMETETKLKEVLETIDNYSIRRNNLSLNRARMAPLARFEAVYLK
jgi:heat shock protein HslJ